MKEENNKKKAFNDALKKWYSQNARNLPWRRTTDPYAIWISEIMLQQTQAARVASKFYPAFISKFPNLETLAKSNWEEVFPLWDGLGFYRRGKNILKTAQILQKKFNGQLPQDIVLLSGLPGIGAYTSAAIMAFAWDEKMAAIDTNIEKVLSVAFAERNIKQIATELVQASDGGRDWNNGMMDLASFIRQTRSIPEVFKDLLPASKVQEVFFVKKKKRQEKSTRDRRFTMKVGVACIHRDGKYLVQTRPDDKSFSGQWEFPGGKKEHGENMRACVKREVMEELGCRVSVRPAFCVVKHSFDKIKLHLHFHRCQIQQGEPIPQENQKIKWVSTEEFDAVGFLDTNSDALEKLKKMKKV